MTLLVAFIGRSGRRMRAVDCLAPLLRCLRSASSTDPLGEPPVTRTAVARGRFRRVRGRLGLVALLGTLGVLFVVMR